MATWDACRQYVMVRTLLLFLLLTCSLSFPSPAWSQTTKRVVLQGFWWDYWNNNYPFAWANYLADLAPRLSELGIDAVWIPPTIKNEGDLQQLAMRHLTTMTLVINSKRVMSALA